MAKRDTHTGEAAQDWHDYYAILGLYDPDADFGLGPDATPEQIKRAWRSELVKWHPDNFRPAGSSAWHAANERTRLINEAYEVLSKPDSKEQYDKEWGGRRKRRQQRRKAPPRTEEEAVVQPDIVVEWDPPEAANVGYFYDLKPGDKLYAGLWVRPKFPRARAFRVCVAEPLPRWLKVSPLSFTPPARLTIEVDATGIDLGAGTTWLDMFDLELVLDE